MTSSEKSFNSIQHIYYIYVLNVIYLALSFKTFSSLVRSIPGLLETQLTGINRVNDDQ